MTARGRKIVPRDIQLVLQPILDQTPIIPELFRCSGTTQMKQAK